ncbi:hypothetical protein XAUB_15180 [Xanthomonas citri pv. aurantifolii str. ICPB 11122]|nr:hypothetical protein XAUB_15180 [Xanthomonas citri pv. aurantifolii str. ICPB 11122]
MLALDQRHQKDAQPLPVLGHGPRRRFWLLVLFRQLDDLGHRQVAVSRPLGRIRRPVTHALEEGPHVILGQRGHGHVLPDDPGEQAQGVTALQHGLLMQARAGQVTQMIGHRLGQHRCLGCIAAGDALTALAQLLTTLGHPCRRDLGGLCLPRPHHQVSEQPSIGGVVQLRLRDARAVRQRHIFQGQLFNVPIANLFQQFFQIHGHPFPHGIECHR